MVYIKLVLFPVFTDASGPNNSNKILKLLFEKNVDSISIIVCSFFAFS